MAGKKMVFIYVGKNSNGIAYKTPTDTQLKKFSKATEIVLCTGNTTIYMTSSTERAALASQIADMTYQIKNAIGKKVWIPTPMINSELASLTEANNAAATILAFMNTVKTSINARFGSTTAFNTNVIGVYVNKEHITNRVDSTNPIHNLDPASLTSMKKHPDVSLFTQIRTAATSMALQTLWCPYFGHGSNYAPTINDIGYVANLHTIFDYVYLQPHYYFLKSPDIFKNFGAIRKSCATNRVHDRDLVPVGSQKGSTTKIGVQMELDRYWYSGNRTSGGAQDAATNAELKYRNTLYEKCIKNEAIAAKSPDHGALPILSGYSKADTNISYYLDSMYSASDEAWYNALSALVDSYFA